MRGDSQLDHIKPDASTGKFLWSGRCIPSCMAQAVPVLAIGSRVRPCALCPVFHLYNPVNSCCLPALPNANSPTRLSCTHCPRAASFPVSHHAWAPYPALWVLPTAPRPPQLGAELLQLGAGPSCLMSQGSAMSAPAHSTHVLPADRGTPGRVAWWAMGKGQVAQGQSARVALDRAEWAQLGVGATGVGQVGL